MQIYFCNCPNNSENRVFNTKVVEIMCTFIDHAAVEFLMEVKVNITLIITGGKLHVINCTAIYSLCFVT